MIFIFVAYATQLSTKMVYNAYSEKRRELSDYEENCFTDIGVGAHRHGVCRMCRTTGGGGRRDPHWRTEGTDVHGTCKSHGG